MKKIIFTLFTILLIGFSANSKNVVDYFIDMPSILMPTFGSSYRVELVENFQKTGKDSVQNLFGTQVKLLALDTVSQNIRVQATQSSRFEMQLLRQKNDTVIGIINTVCAPICSSYIKFYDTEWRELNQDLPKFGMKDWLKHSNSDEESNQINNLIKANFIEYNFNPEEQKINVQSNSLENLSREDKEFVNPLSTNKIYVLKWSDKNGRWMIE